MNEEMMNQLLLDQIDRLINMQNTMLTAVGVLFAVVIGLFTFFQWRINSRDQKVIIDTTKQEILYLLINEYYLLEIRENKRKILENNKTNTEQIKQVFGKMSEMEKELLINNHKDEINMITLESFIIIEEMINLKNNFLNDIERDKLFAEIKSFALTNGKDSLREALARSLLYSLNRKSNNPIKDINILKNTINK